LIIYQANKTDFLHHALREDIEDIVSKHYGDATGRSVSPSEILAWKHSLLEMAKVLQDEEIPSDAGIAIEYQLPQTSKRIDFVIAGEDDQARSTVIIVELKQWSESRRSEKDALIWARRGGPTGEREGPHPCYQAWSYAAYLRDFNAAVQERAMDLRPCAYLHNHPRNGEIDHPHYGDHIAQAPLFLAKERSKLQAFIRAHVRHGDRRKALYAIENGQIRPSRMLADCVKAMLQGKTEFVMIDDQKVVYESVLAADAQAKHKRQVVIVQGGPGTGKSVVAVNALAKLIERQRNARYVSKNAAPREVYAAKLAGTFKKTRISNLFSGSGSFHKTEADTYDVLIVDEAHRLNEKSGLYRNEGENQIREVIRSARCAVFFVDDDQRVTIYDIGHTAEIRRIAVECGAEVTDLELSSQFRCNGSDGYLAWLDDTLDIRQTANNALNTSEYDFRVFDNPAAMHALVEEKNRSNNRSRVVAGYCWKWPSKKNSAPYDIVMDEFEYRRRWNLAKDGSLWIVAPDSVDEIGCIHTCQGLELDYVGVIIGPDLIFHNGKVVADAQKRATSDQTVKGLKKMMRENPAQARRLGDLIVKNTYRTLMTRGMKGCFVYCVDPALAQYLRSRIHAKTIEMRAGLNSEPAAPVDVAIYPFRRVSSAERQAGRAAVPIVDLEASAERLVGAHDLAAVASDWAASPDWITPQPGMFVSKVTGESLDPRVPSGAWGLFRLAAGKPRDGSVIITHLRDLQNPGGRNRFRVQIYGSQRVADEDTGQGEVVAEFLTLMHG
jgi:DUF2075 family protein/molybdopterin biosynthesis enzyme MoaB